MNSSCLDYRMTDEQRMQFDEQGYLIVENAIGHSAKMLDAGFIQRSLDDAEAIVLKLSSRRGHTRHPTKTVVETTHPACPRGSTR